MRIAKVLNNNLAIVVNDEGDDVIVMGRGLAFGRRRGDEVDPSKVERVFTQRVPELSHRLDEMVGQIPEEYFEAAQAIVAYARQTLDKQLDDSIYLALTDHMHFAVERYRKGITIENRLLIETQFIYPDEFAVARRAVAYLNREFSVDLPDDEAAFITLHLVNASVGGSVDQTVRMTKIIQQAIDTIQDYFHIEPRRDSLEYYRLMVHLKFFARRVVTGEPTPEDPTDERRPEELKLDSLIRLQYRDASACADRVAEGIEREHGYQVSESERSYLAVHIQRVRNAELGRGGGP